MGLFFAAIRAYALSDWAGAGSVSTAHAPAAAGTTSLALSLSASSSLAASLWSHDVTSGFLERTKIFHVSKNVIGLRAAFAVIVGTRHHSLDFTVKEGLQNILDPSDNAGDHLDIHRMEEIHSPGPHPSGDNHVGPQ